MAPYNVLYRVTIHKSKFVNEMKKRVSVVYCVYKIKKKSYYIFNYLIYLYFIYFHLFWSSLHCFSFTKRNSFIIIIAAQTKRRSEGVFSEMFYLFFVLFKIGAEVKWRCDWSDRGSLRSRSDIEIPSPWERLSSRAIFSFGTVSRNLNLKWVICQSILLFSFWCNNEATSHNGYGK